MDSHAQEQLTELGARLGITKCNDETVDEFASRLHHHIDELIRRSAQSIIQLMDAHDLVAELAP